MSFPDRCTCPAPGECPHLPTRATDGIWTECQTNPRFRLRMANVPADQWPQEKHAARPRPTPSPAHQHEMARRTAICQECPEWKDGYCSIIRKVCAARARVPWNEPRCPEGRWKLPVVSSSKPVYPGLWIGSVDKAKSLVAQMKRTITVADDTRWSGDVLYPLHDHGPNDLEMLASAIWDAATSSHEQPTMVHCRAGVNRSATVVVGAICLRTGSTIDNALAFLKRQHKEARPHAEILGQLAEVLPRLRDRWSHPFSRLLPENVPDGITIAITHWQRPTALRRLLASIRQLLPGWPVDVEDTGGNLSAGRNRLYSRVKTPLLVMMEEDFVVTETTVAALPEALSILDHDPAIMGVGGMCLEYPQRKQWQHNYELRGKACYLVPSRRPLRRAPSGIEYRPCDLVLNWGIFRTDLFRRVPWDEDFAIMEHASYYWKASRAGNEFAYWSGLKIDHIRQTERVGNYRNNRNRDFSRLVPKKFGFRFRGGI